LWKRRWRDQIQGAERASSEGSDISTMKQDLELVLRWADFGWDLKEVAQQTGA
jgi:hypothetical protein